MSDSAFEYIIYTPGQKQNVMLLHTVITPSPGLRQYIFVLPMKFCTQMEQNRDPVELAELLFLCCSISFFFFFCFRVSACTGVVHYLYTQVWWNTNTRIRTRNSVGSSYIESNIASLSFVTLWHYFFNRIKIPGKGFRSGHWSGAGGDGHQLLNKKQRWRREVHRGQPLLLYRRVKARKKGGGGAKWSLFPWNLLHKKVA